MPGPFTYPVAISVPFDNEDNDFDSENVQDAIEEAVDLAIQASRYLVLADYGGNANNGRLLEFFPGLDSEEAPIFFDSGTKVIQLIMSTTSNSSSATIGFYDIVNDPSFNTPLYTLDMNNQKRKIDNGSMGTPLFTIPPGGALTVKVDSSNINKPHLQMIFSGTS